MIAREIHDRLVGELGAENVIIPSYGSGEAEATTLPRGPRIAGRVRPANTEEVVRVVRLANEFALPIHPVSTGRNWGYGDGLPVGDNNLVIDLSRMQACEIEPRLAYAVVEPGVTQGQLAAVAAGQKPPLQMDCTGAGPDTSVIGNILERGFGHSPYGDRSRYIAGLEVVLPDGRMLRTGFGHYENARARDVYPHGVGPGLDGLFLQSNLGIVTRMAVWLMPRPDVTKIFMAEVDDDAGLGTLVEHLRQLAMEGTLRGVVHIANDLRGISSQIMRPIAGAGAPPLDESGRGALRKRYKTAAWTAVGSVAGPAGITRLSARRIRRQLAGSGARVRVLTGLHFALARRLPILPTAKRDALQAVLDINTGWPNGYFLRSAYWHVARPDPVGPDDLDPARDGCGLVWIAPVAPATARDVKRVIEIARRSFEAHGFDFFATLSLCNPRSVVAVLSIAFDKAHQLEAADRCRADVLTALIDAGYPPYRVDLTSMNLLNHRSTGFWDVAASIRRSLDPNGVLSPGRYQPQSDFHPET